MPASKLRAGDTPKLTPEQTEVLRLVRDGATLTPVWQVALDGKTTTCSVDTIDTLMDHGFIAEPESDDDTDHGTCDGLPAESDVVYADHIRGHACEHGSAHLVLYDKDDEPFACASMPLVTFERLVSEVIESSDGHDVDDVLSVLHVGGSKMTH